jgi:DNA (cytosine-5)-methyltransferase 1
MMFGSLFSGIGGIDLGLQRAGMTPAWHSEIEPYACRVLAKHWPDVPNLGDIRDIDWTGVAGVDLVAGGYPCQPFSHAGVRRGEEDPRHLWPMFAECLRVVRPRYALLENVSGHLSLGFGSVLADLAALGYDAQWDCIPAAAVGAPHLRDRVFVIAARQDVLDTDCESQSGRTVNGGSTGHRPEQRRPLAYTDNRRPFDALRAGWNAPWHGSPHVADTCSARLERAREAEPTANASGQNGTAWATEPNVGRVADGVPRRMDRLRGLGNAVVPQVAEHVGRLIMGMEAAR